MKTKIIRKYPFNYEEMTIILETANVALSDAELFDEIAERLDVNDDEMKRLQQKLEKYMGKTTL